MREQEIKGYRDLMVWQRAMDLVVRSYEVTKGLPKSEQYGLISQIQRAAVSIPANIAEGKGRRHLGDYLRHLSIARGSLMELETHVLIAERLSYVTPQQADAVLKLTEEISRLLSSLQQALEKRR
ncbi:four helix bundle protein [Leptolyngbya sp. NIES-2104]|uniref:four helix bundle protein n=1 Tax=Leptolyngbya sp. NIES-2104 TaxID=1552121 RepID=UPI00073E9CBE|nr:four helix bundle protein [Leptolyngbya sp. NIES-2104]